MALYEVQHQIESGREQILARLTFESAVFKVINDRHKRAGGLDPEINREKASSIRYIDKLLDKLITPEALPIEETTGVQWETEPIDVRAE